MIDVNTNKFPIKKKDSCQPSQKEPQNFRTKDLYLASYLKCLGIPLKTTEKVDNKLFFIFEGKANFKRLVNEYFNDAKVGVLSFKASLRDLRSIIFNQESLINSKDSQ